MRSKLKSIGELNLSASTRFSLFQDVEHLVTQDIAPNHCKIRRSIFDAWLFNQVVHNHHIRVSCRGHRCTAVEVNLRLGDLHECDDVVTGCLVNLKHSAQQHITGIDDIVTQKDSKTVVCDVAFCSEDCMSETLGVTLSGVVDIG